MEPKINSEALIEAYNRGESMNSIAKRFDTYPTTVRRILKKNNVKLRHDAAKKGSLMVKDGEKLIEWAKAQGRLVTKSELAEVLGKKRLSPSYFEKYPELGKYIVIREQNELQEYSQKLYNWLQENNIPYKPNDRKKLNVVVTALLLGKYSNFILQLNIKPKCISKRQFERNMEERLNRASKSGMVILFLNEKHFENLNKLKSVLETYKD